MPCLGLWDTFTLRRRNLGPVDFNGRIFITSIDPANHIVAVDVLNNAGTPIPGRRRFGTCVPIAGVDQSLLSIIIRGSSRNFPVSGIVSPESSASTFTGTYVTDPDTGDTGTGTGSQITLLRTPDGAAKQSASGAAGKGAGKSAKGGAKKGGAKKGRK